MAAERDLRRILARKPLLAFDYDGTLAPITGRPEQTVTPPAIRDALRTLGLYAPVAILTGRSRDDAASRLQLPDARIIGNHGAEGLPDTDTAALQAQVQQWDALIRQHFSADIQRAGLYLENKGCSLSLHTRLATDANFARQLLRRIRLALPASAYCFAGKCILNIVPFNAPDKAAALHHLVANDQDMPGRPAIYLGDDLNDEVVFQRAPAHWMTIRVGPHRHSAARYYARRQQDVLWFLLITLNHLRR
ncbi:trehalose-phosphatase [Viridibacterium curvum]|uniref:Trehalose 6-phosphate phosphatase n=2 Tax=Viridibacterium curvum TaxID=1101404 RepID=A0ABP9QKE6_9RHOO